MEITKEALEVQLAEFQKQADAFAVNHYKALAVIEYIKALLAGLEAKG